MSSLVGERQVGEAFEETIWARVIESQQLPQAIGSQFLPQGIKMSRRALQEHSDFLRFVLRFSKAFVRSLQQDLRFCTFAT